jgi:hypothetical protein
MRAKRSIFMAGIFVLSVLFLYQSPAFPQTGFSTSPAEIPAYLSNPSLGLPFLKSPAKFSSLRPGVSYQKKESFLGGIFPAKDVPSRRVVAKLGVGLANEFSGFSWTADEDKFKEGGSIYPMHLGLTLQIGMLHGIFLDLGYQMNKEFT